MNKEIAIIREVVVKVTQLLAGKGLKVTQQGAQAYVKFDKSGKPVVVNIPHIPDNATPDLLMAIQGFMDHEVAHILFTEYDFGNAEKKKNKGLHELHNLVEDPLIEKRMGEKFPGSTYNLRRLAEFFVDKITAPKLLEVKGDKSKEFGILLVPVVRALSGQKVFAEWLTKNKYWDHELVAEFVKKMPKASIDGLVTMRTTRDSFAIAKVMHGVLYPPPPPTPPAPPTPPPPPSNPSKPSKTKEKSEDTDGEGDNTELPEDADDKGTGGDSADSDDKSEVTGDEAGEPKDDKSDESESDDEADGDDKPVSDGEKSEDSGADDDAGEDEDDGGASDAEESDEDGVDAKDSGDGADAEPDDGVLGDDDAGTEGSGDEDDGKKDGADDTSADAGEDEAAGSGGGQSAGDPEGEDAGDSEPGGDADEPGVGSSKFSDADIDLKDSSFEGALEGKITADTTKLTADCNYTIFTKDFDSIEVYDREVTDEQFVAFDEQTKHMIAPMQKDIERLMASRSQVLKVPGYRSGKLNGASLYRLKANDDRVFRRVHEAKSKDTAVSLLIDNSGSMIGQPIEVAMAAGYALSQTLERVGIAHEALGFTTGRNGRLSAALINAEEARIGSYFSRLETLQMPIFKGFDERLTPAVKRRFASLAEHQDIMANNVDGECVEIAAQRLSRRKEHRKVLMVFSDGQPAGASNNPHAYGQRSPFRSHLKRVVQDAIRAGIEVIGIGIMTEAVKAYYPKYIVLNDVATLPSTVMGELKRILSAA